MKTIGIFALLLLGIGGANFMMGIFGEAQVAASGSANPMLTNYGALACKILIVVLLLYGIYYIVHVVKTAVEQRKPDNSNKFDRPK